MTAPNETPLEVNPVCANCGAPLLGEYCYACGQPVKGLVRHLSGVLGDVFDTVLNIDSRVLRTLPALFLHPGFLTREYFAGRRVRYVTPFRLMFFLCLAAFFVLQLVTDNGMSTVHFNTCIGSHARSCRATDKVASASGAPSMLSGVDYDSFQQATTPAQVKAKENEALAQIDRAAANPDLPTLARDSLDMARQAVRDKATQRLAELDAAAKTTAPATTQRSAAMPTPANSAGRESSDTDDDAGKT
nr:DUF3667 domain-containing protein [Pseudomonadota bacterium]